MDNPPPIPDQPQEKKGLSKLACFGIGCGALFIVALIAVVVSLALFLPAISQALDDFAENPDKVAAELFAKMDESVEFVESDSEAGTITVRVRETGEIITIPFAQFNEENFSIADFANSRTLNADDSGNVDVNTGDAQVVTRQGEAAKDLAPAWVLPIVDLPDMIVQTGVLAAAGGEQMFGTLTLAADDPPQAVATRFKAAMEEAGMEVSENPSPDFRSIRLDAQTPDGPLTVECQTDGDGSAIAVTFQFVPEE